MQIHALELSPPTVRSPLTVVKALFGRIRLSPPFAVTLRLPYDVTFAGNIYRKPTVPSIS